MSRAGPKRRGLLKSLKKRDRAGGGCGAPSSSRDSRGAAFVSSGLVRIAPGAAIRGFLKIYVFLKEYLGFSWSREVTKGSGMSPGRCLGEHFGAPSVLLVPLKVPG